MKKARFTLIALVLLAGIGGALAFKANRFTANPVQGTTDCLSIRIGPLTYYCCAGLNGVPLTLCTPNGLVYWHPNMGITLNQFSTILATVTFPCTATTTTVGGGTTTLTITRTIHSCIPTTGLATFLI